MALKESTEDYGSIFLSDVIISKWNREIASPLMCNCVCKYATVTTIEASEVQSLCYGSKSLFSYCSWCDQTKPSYCGGGGTNQEPGHLGQADFMSKLIHICLTNTFNNQKKRKKNSFPFCLNIILTSQLCDGPPSCNYSMCYSFWMS